MDPRAQDMAVVLGADPAALLEDLTSKDVAGGAAVPTPTDPASGTPRS